MEIAVIVVVILLLFGARSLPDKARNMGKALREFKRSVTGEDRDDSEEEKKKS